MNNPDKPLTDKEWNDAPKFNGIDGLPDDVRELVRSAANVGRPVSENPKKQLTVRLDADIVDWLKSEGKGYQTRMNAILRDAMPDTQTLHKNS